MSIQNYYHFSEDGKECNIKRYDTPVPWLNLLSNDRFVAWISHSGNIIESCLINNQKNRLTNPKSGYIYIKDTDSGEHFMSNSHSKILNRLLNILKNLKNNYLGLRGGGSQNKRKPLDIQS